MNKTMNKILRLCTLITLILNFNIFSEEHFFGGWSISKEMFDYIRETLPENKTILELGSGWASGLLSNHYKVYSIENDPYWINKYNTNYIFAPLKNGWYDTKILKAFVPLIKYDLLLIDGPIGENARSGFLENLDLFNLKVPIIVDDIHFKRVKDDMYKLAKVLKPKEVKIITCPTKAFAVLIPNV